MPIAPGTFRGKQNSPAARKKRFQQFQTLLGKRLSAPGATDSPLGAFFGAIARRGVSRPSGVVRGAFPNVNPELAERMARRKRRENRFGKKR